MSRPAVTVLVWVLREYLVAATLLLLPGLLGALGITLEHGQVARLDEPRGDKTSDAPSTAPPA